MVWNNLWLVNEIRWLGEQLSTCMKENGERNWFSLKETFLMI